MRFLPLLLVFAACAPEPAPVPAAPLPSELAAPLAPEAGQTLAPKTEWTTRPIDLPGETSGVTVTAVRVAQQDGYDRVVFDFEGGQPGVQVKTVDSVEACGSGDVLQVEGASILSVALTGARGHTEGGEETIRHTSEAHSFPSLVQTVPACDFEGRVEWALGLTAPEAYRVMRLSSPDRLAIDIRHTQ